MDEFQKIYDIEVNESDKDYIYDELYTKLADKDAIIYMLTNTIDEVMMKGSSHIRVYCNYAMEFDNISIEYARENKIYIMNTPNILNDLISESAWTCILAISRRTVEGDKYIKNKNFRGG